MYPELIALTDTQKEALKLDQNVFVRAGAGSGKTSILVQRFLKILWENPDLKISQILAITFTKKAAGEMLSRIRNYVETLSPKEPKNQNFKERILYSIHTANISTIHSFCSNLIRQFPFETQIVPDFEVLDDEANHLLLYETICMTLDQAESKKDPLLLELLYSFNRKEIIKHLLTLFKNKNTFHMIYQNYLTLPQDQLLQHIEIPDEDKSATRETLHLTILLLKLYAKCNKNYQEIKEKKGKLDYEDQIEIARKALLNHAHIRMYFQSHFQFIMVDEFQDTDPTQWEIIQTLFQSSESKKLFLVGDEKQAIYRFRGIDSTLFTTIYYQFQKNLDITINLSENFRSSPKIIEFINTIFSQIFTQSQNSAHTQYVPLIPKRIHSEKEDSFIEFGLLTPTPNETRPKPEQEADQIAHWILDKMQQHPTIQYKDIAILFRGSTFIDTYKTILTRYGIPNTILKGKGFYQKTEILDLFMLLKGLVNQRDNLAWLRILKSPIFGISDMGIFELYQQFSEETVLQKLAAFEKTRMALTLETDYILLQSAYSKIKSWIDLMQTCPIGNVFEAILTQTGAWTIYSASQDGEQRIANIQKLLQKIQKWTRHSVSSWYDLDLILTHHIETSNEQEENLSYQQQNTVTLMTIHGAKGLEFPYVVIPELHRDWNSSKSESLVFHSKIGIGLSTQNEKEKNRIRTAIFKEIEIEIREEEKRIFYVACTRAKKGLFLTGILKEKKTETTQPKSYLDLILQACNPILQTNHIQFDSISYPRISLPNPTNSTQSQPITTQSKLAIELDTCKPKNIISSEYYPISVSNLTQKLINTYPAHFKPPPLTKSPISSPLLPSNPNAASWIGLVIHFILATIHQRPAFVSNSADEWINLCRLPAHIMKDEPLLSRIRHQINLYLKSPILQKIQSTQFQFFEKEFVVKINKWIINGRMDCLIKTPSGFEIIDYKTNHTPDLTFPLLSQSADPKTLHPYQLQLGIYALAVQQLFQLPAIPISGTLFLTASGESKSFPLDPNFLKNLKDFIAKTSCF